MKAWLLGGLLLLVGVARGQAHDGIRMDFRFCRVVLAGGDTLDGPASVRFSTDLLFLTLPDSSVRTLAPSAVAAFAVQERVPTALSSCGLTPKRRA